LVGALQVHPYKHCADYPQKSVRGVAGGFARVEVFWAPLIGVPLLSPSRNVAEVLRKSHCVSGLPPWSHLPFEMCPRNRIKPSLPSDRLPPTVPQFRARQRPLHVRAWYLYETLTGRSSTSRTPACKRRGPARPEGVLHRQAPVLKAPPGPRQSSRRWPLLPDH
jgi:hypothetical protein